MGRDFRSRSRRREPYSRRASRPFDRSDRRPDSRDRRPARRTTSGPHDNVNNQIPSSWSPSTGHFDNNKEYGIPFPSVVESIQWTRKAQIAGCYVEDIRLVDVVPNGLQHYGVRALVNGRYITFEMLRTRLGSLIIFQVMNGVTTSVLQTIDATLEFHQ